MQQPPKLTPRPRPTDWLKRMPKRTWVYAVVGVVILLSMAQGMSAQTGAGTFLSRLTVGNPTGPTPVLGQVNAEKPYLVEGTPVVPSCTDNKIIVEDNISGTAAAVKCNSAFLTTATPANNSTLKVNTSNTVEFDTATPTFTPIPTVTPIPPVATDTPIPPVATATPIPPVATPTAELHLQATTATPAPGTFLQYPGTPGPAIWVTAVPTSGPGAAPTAFPTCAVGVFGVGTGGQGLQCGSSALSTATPAAGTIPYCSAGGAGCVLAYVTPVPPSTSAQKELCYASATASQSITSTVAPGTDLTGLTCTVTPDGTHPVFIEALMASMQTNTNINAYLVVQKGGSAVQECNQSRDSANNLYHIYCAYRDSAPAASSTVYKLSMFSGTTQTITANANNASTSISFIRVSQVQN